MDKSDERILVLYGVSCLLGILVGIVGSCFQIGINTLDHSIHQFFKFFNLQGISLILVSGFTSMIMVTLAWFLVKGFAPEASGSGVQEIEGALLHRRGVFWRRLLPVKFIGGILAISSKLVMGREGPTIQLGGNLGEMVGEWFGIVRHRRDSLVAAGAAAGLATAFNAPLAGVLFIIEEMRNVFNFSFTNFKMVIITCVAATIMMHSFLGDKPAIVMPVFSAPDLSALGLFFIFGIIVGFVGLYFNKVLMFSLSVMDRLGNKFKSIYIPAIGFLVGVLAIKQPHLVGGGYSIIDQAISINLPINLLCFILVSRFFMTMMCYSTSVPGGIFAPMLALGTVLGMLVDQVFSFYIHNYTVFPGMFAVAGMGALFAAAVRAPITGIVLVVEMTQNYNLILPLMVSCLTSTTVVQLAKNPPIYSQLLKRTLKNSK